MTATAEPARKLLRGEVPRTFSHSFDRMVLAKAGMRPCSVRDAARAAPAVSTPRLSRDARSCAPAWQRTSAAAARGQRGGLP